MNPKEFKENIFKSEICYLSTTDKKGNPHVKPIWFVNYKDEIWFETHIPTKAYRNILVNNKISICFGGKDTYIIYGSVKQFTEEKCPIPFRKLLWEKYPKDMDDSFIRPDTLIFKVEVTKELGWQYSPSWEDIKFDNTKQEIHG